ncbi:MAG: flavin-containing monooxygenase, partial [Nocardioidaceae bacterium]
AYRSLHINTSRQLMEYRSFPMPKDLPDYPNHWQIAAYFDAYVDHFGFRDKITFRTEVVKVVPDGRGFEVTLRGRNRHGEALEPEMRAYEHVIVANGHHWDPRWPEPSFPGAETFPGQQLHAHYYKTPDPLEGRRVLVLGIGNSATDIAVESSRVAEETYLAMRRGAHIVPKYLFGVPTDHLTDSPLVRAPLKAQQVAMSAMLRLTQGKLTDYGLPEPDHGLLHAHPTVSDDLLSRLGHGDITVKPNIDRFEGPKVFFVDGSATEVDTVVYCTGYRISFPFLDERVVRATDNHVDLYRRVVDPDHRGLYFVGLIQPLGAIMPLAEAQAGWVCDLVTGEGELPSYDEMRRQIRVYDDQVRRRYVASKRHTIQVDFHRYLAEIEHERRASRQRAQGLPARGGVTGRLSLRRRP